MSDNVDYYRQFAAEFFRTTVAVDMTAIRQQFLAHIPAGARILDAGCGSGRDAKAFAELGFKVTAFDATPELAALATEHCGFHVVVRRFEDVAETSAYDGIWCCASLLHVPLSEMHDALTRLWAALAVVFQEVVHSQDSADGRPVAERAVWPMPVVAVQEGLQRGLAFG